MTRIELVRACYADVLKEISDALIENRSFKTSEIIRDWKCCAAEEWEDLTIEEVDAEFDRLYEIVKWLMHEEVKI